MVPEPIDGRALEDGGEDGCYGVCGHKSEAAPAGPDKPGLSENAKVKGQD